MPYVKFFPLNEFRFNPKSCGTTRLFSACTIFTTTPRPLSADFFLSLLRDTTERDRDREERRLTVVLVKVAFGSDFLTRLEMRPLGLELFPSVEVRFTPTLFFAGSFFVSVFFFTTTSFFVVAFFSAALLPAAPFPPVIRLRVDVRRAAGFFSESGSGSDFFAFDDWLLVLLTLATTAADFDLFDVRSLSCSSFPSRFDMLPCNKWVDRW
jgi:hypothetical protein